MKASNILMSLCVLVVMAISSVSAFCADDAKKGSAKFESDTHDFGIVKEEGGPVTCEFPFENVGGGNLIIYEAKAECGCTRPEYPKAPIAPGKNGVIKVTYNPLGRPGAFSKMVTVKCNGNPSKIRLKIRGTVSPKSK